MHMSKIVLDLATVLHSYLNDMKSFLLVPAKGLESLRIRGLQNSSARKCESKVANKGVFSNPAQLNTFQACSMNCHGLTIKTILSQKQI